VKLDRREFLERAAVVLGASLTPSCVTAVLEQPPEEPLRTASPLLSPEERANLAALVDRILPETDTPGALAAGVPDFIEFVLVEGQGEAERESFRAGLRRLERTSRERHGPAFSATTPGTMDALLQEIEGEEFAAAPPGLPLSLGGTFVPKPFFATAKELTIVGYYTSEVGMKHELQFSHWPGRFDGDVPVQPGVRPWAGGGL
jgi:hypothetical protein